MVSVNFYQIIAARRVDYLFFEQAKTKDCMIRLALETGHVGLGSKLDYKRPGLGQFQTNTN